MEKYQNVEAKFGTSKIVWFIVALFVASQLISIDILLKIYLNHLQ